MAHAIFRTEGALAHKILRKLHTTYTVVVKVIAAEGGDMKSPGSHRASRGVSSTCETKKVMTHERWTAVRDETRVRETDDQWKWQGMGNGGLRV